LYFYGRTDRVHRAVKSADKAVAGPLDDASVISLCRRRNQGALKVFHAVKGIGLVFGHQPAITDYIGNEHGEQPPLFGGLAHTILGSEEDVE